MKVLEAITGVIACAFLWLSKALYSIVPKRRAYGFGVFIANLIYPFFRSRRALAIDNILFPHLGLADKEHTSYFLAHAAESAA